MIHYQFLRSPLVVGLLLVAGGCAASPPPVTVTTPELLGVPVAVVEEEVLPPREPDITARERWRSPFAVSASGRVEPVNRRSVVIIDSDPAIAAGIAEQEAIDLDRPVRSAANGEARSDAGSDSVRTHRVQRGDTWSGIAVRYRIPTRALAEANPDVDPERIEIGQTLVIPETD